MFFHSATHWGWFSFSRADSRAATAGWHWLLLQGCRTVHYIKQVYAINDAARGAQTDGQREGQKQSEREREGRGDSWLHGRTLATEAGLRAANRNTHTHTDTLAQVFPLTHTHTHTVAHLPKGVACYPGCFLVIIKPSREHMKMGMTHASKVCLMCIFDRGAGGDVGVSAVGPSRCLCL